MRVCRCRCSDLRNPLLQYWQVCRLSGSGELAASIGRGMDSGDVSNCRMEMSRAVSKKWGTGW